MDPELIERLNEQLREMTELLSQQNATMAAQVKAMQSQANASNAATAAKNTERNAVNQNSSSVNENTKKQEAYMAAEQQREQQRQELHASFRSAMQGTIGSLTSFKDALLGTERGFAKYGQTFNSLGDAAWDVGKNFGILGGALGGLAKGVGMAAGAVLQQTDNMNNFADTFKNMGAVGGMTNTKLLEMAQSAGYASQDLQKLAKPIATLGSAITNIGGTAAEGQKAFMNIINIGDTARMKFNRLGMQIEEVNDAQANFIALQRMSGNAFSNSAKDQEKLRKTSLEYTENLVELAALTGTDIETLKKKQQIAFQEYQELVTTQAENARIAELKRKVAETGDKDAQAELKRLEARAAARDQVKQETDELFGTSMGAQIRDYLRSGGRVSETNIGAYQLAGPQLEQFRQMYESGASREEMSKFMRENLSSAMKENIGKRAGDLGGTINVMDPRSAEELGNLFGLEKELMTKLAGREPGKAPEAEKGVEEAGKEGFDKAADSRAALTELEIKAKVALDQLLLSINPLSDGFNAGTAAALALAAAAVGAAVALGRMALVARMGGLPASPGKGPKPVEAGGGPTKPSTPAEKRAASRAAAKQAAIAEARAAKGASAAEGAGKLGKLGKVLGGASKWLGRAAGPLAAVGAVAEGYVGYQEAAQQEKEGKITAAQAKQQKGQAIGGAVGGGLGGAAGGALAGAAIGSVVPVVGTAIGGIIGGALGYYLGNKAGSAIGGMVAGSGQDEKAKLAHEKATQEKLAADKTKADQTSKDAAGKSSITPQHIDQFAKSINAFGSLITSFGKIVTAFAKTVTAFAVTTKAYATSTKNLAESINKLTRMTTIGSTVKTTNNRSTALDNLVAGTIGEAEEALTPMEQFQNSLTTSANQMKLLREEELKRHRFTELSMSQFRKSIEDAAKKLDTISGIDRSGGGGGGGTTGPSEGGDGSYGFPAGKVVEAGKGYTTVEYADGRVEKREGSRNWRNNNPGNIEYGEFAKKHGAIGSDGRFAVFASYEQGRAAKESLLFESSGYKGLTLGGAISKYAPPNENDTSRYIRTVAKAIGRSADTPLADLTPEQRKQMLDAMEKVEGFKKGKVEVLQEGRGGSLKELVGKVLTLGGGVTGNARNLENINPGLDARASAAFKEYNQKTGKKVTLTSGFRYPGDQAKIDSGSNPKAAPGMSRHEKGLALDVNSADVSEMNNLGLLEKYGLVGGVASSRKGGYINDPPHIELKARKGGIFDGPDTGYPVEMHGSEMVAPLNMDSVLMKLAKTPADTPVGEMMEKMLQGPQAGVGNDSVEKIMQMHSELIDVLSRKLDNMLDKLDDGNDTRQKILKNSQT